MKKIFILSCTLVLLSSYSANAQIAVVIGEPQPVYYAPSVYAPGYVEYSHRYPSQYYDNHNHHRHNDWSYWANQRKGKEEHDNGNHGHK